MKFVRDVLHTTYYSLKFIVYFFLNYNLPPRMNTKNNTGRDLFDYAKMHTLVKVKDNIDPTAVFVGRDHPELNYGQTGTLFFNDKWNPDFVPDGDTQGCIVKRSDVCRVGDELIIYYNERL